MSARETFEDDIFGEEGWFSTDYRRNTKSTTPCNLESEEVTNCDGQNERVICDTA